MLKNNKFYKKKGFILLSQMRSGTTWLCSLTNSTGEMGNAKEWLKFKPNRSVGLPDHFNFIVNNASSENGNFSLKIFPDQLNKIYRIYGYDFIKKCQEDHDISIILLERSDILRHAISIIRYIAKRSGSTPKYDASYICKVITFIEYNKAFLRAYLCINRFNYNTFIYEDLINNPTPYLSYVQSVFGLPKKLDFSTDRKILRDNLTEEWVERFRTAVDHSGGFPHYVNPLGAPRTPANLMRFLTGAPLL